MRGVYFGLLDRTNPLSLGLLDVDNNKVSAYGYFEKDDLPREQ